MTARQAYASDLAALPDDDVPAYLSARSGLPGPRGNLELMAAFGDVAPAQLVVRLADEPDEYLRGCGTAALGRLLLEAAGDSGSTSGGRAPDEPSGALPAEAAAVAATLTQRAKDPLWRVREAAAMAGQRLGAGAPERLVALTSAWLATGDPLVARAAIAALCEPPILTSPLLRTAALDACDAATRLLRSVPAASRREADVRTLRKGLAYCWSVAVAADPVAGLPRFRVLATDADPDVAWVARENAKKNRLARLL